MSSVLSADRKYWDVTVPDFLVGSGAGTGWPIFLNESAEEAMYAQVVQTGCWECIGQRGMYEGLEVNGKPEVFWLCDRGGLVREVAFVDSLDRPTSNWMGVYSNFVQDYGTSDFAEHYIETVPVPLTYASGFRPLSLKLVQRLGQFRASGPGAIGVPDRIVATAVKLIMWLTGQSAAVSATVSGDGVLSIATEFPKEVRLYIEIEKDGTVGAAVTRERRYARDLEEHTLADLTPEVILAAVRSI